MTARVGIGDFSRMTHLSVPTLRHYHEVGLLPPAEIDPGSGYRFYVPEQVQVAQLTSPSATRPAPPAVRVC